MYGCKQFVGKYDWNFRLHEVEAIWGLQGHRHLAQLNWQPGLALDRAHQVAFHILLARPTRSQLTQQLCRAAGRSASGVVDDAGCVTLHVHRRYHLYTSNQPLLEQCTAGERTSHIATKTSLGTVARHILRATRSAWLWSRAHSPGILVDQIMMYERLLTRPSNILFTCSTCGSRNMLVRWF